jgi:hypothetical protein
MVWRQFFDCCSGGEEGVFLPDDSAKLRIDSGLALAGSVSSGEEGAMKQVGSSVGSRPQGSRADGSEPRRMEEMSLCRVRDLSFAASLASVLLLASCNTTPDRISSRPDSDDFGAAVPGDEDIEVESVQRTEMLHQRTQWEIRLGPSFPFDLFNPGNDPRIDNDHGAFFDTFEGWAIGTKGSLEAQKNLFLGIAFDWSHQNVEDLALSANEAIRYVDEYDRYTFLVGVDYDIPLWEAEDALIFRMGFGTGLVVFTFEDDGTAELE